MYYLTEEDYARAQSNGISRNIAYNRYYRLQWSLERALTEEVNKRPKNSIRARYVRAAIKRGISRNTFNARVQDGWSYAQAAFHPIVTPEERIRRARLANERCQPSRRLLTDEQIKIARMNGIKIGTAKSRVKRNWPPDKAVTTPVNEQYRQKII